MKRLYFLVPNAETAKLVIEDLRIALVQQRNIYVIARPGTMLEQLPEASALQTTRALSAGQSGAMTGGALGAIAGLVAVAFPPSGVVIAGGAILAGAIGGAGLGAWIGSIIGVNTEHPRVKEFHDAIDRGQLLMAVDVPAARVDDIQSQVRHRHPEVLITAVDHVPPKLPW